MAGLQDLLSWADNKRRVMGRNISDLVQNPTDALPMIAERAGETLIDHFKDPMNFVGGGVGMIASSASRMHNMGVIGDQQLRRIVGRGSLDRTEQEMAELERRRTQEYIQRQNPERYIAQNHGQGFAPDEFAELAARVRRPMNDLMDVRTD